MLSPGMGFYSISRLIGRILGIETLRPDCLFRVLPNYTFT